VASIDKYKTAKDEARFEVRWRDGRRRDCSKVFKLKGDALRFKVEVERRQQLGPLYDAPPQRFGTFLDDWLGRYEQAVRPSTYERAVQALRHVRDFAPLYVEQLTAADVEDRIGRVARTAPRQAQQTLAKLKQALRNAQERGQTVDEAIFRIGAPRCEERDPRFLTWAQVEELAATCAEERLIVFASLTGMRQGELFALREENVDLERGVVLVGATAYKGRAAKTKTRSGRRTVHLSRLAKQTLREQLLARLPTATGLVFPSPYGGLWQKDNFMSRVFRPAVKRAALDGLTFHDLRHTCASLMIAAGANPLEVASQLGHKDARLVLQRYGHLYPGASAKAAQLLDNVTGGSSAVGEAWGGA
jgi:integrase